MSADVLDVLVVGGGPAGLSAALLLGRCLRSVLLVDAGEPRNAVSRGLNGFITRDGIGPMELRQVGRAELSRYRTVRVRDGRVAAVRREEGGFEATLADGTVVRSRLVLLATGRIDVLPDRPGFREFYGRGVHHCPFCDAWEHRAGAVGVYGAGGEAAGLARELLTWTPRVVLCSDGPAGPEVDGEGLAAVGITVNAARVSHLSGANGALARIHFADGTFSACDALFFCGPCEQRSPLPEALGCEFNADHSVRCEGYAATGVPGLFVAGNVRGGLHLAIMAAAEGADAAIAMNDILLERSLRAR